MSGRYPIQELNQSDYTLYGTKNIYVLFFPIKRLSSAINGHRLVIYIAKNEYGKYVYISTHVI
jgi:hypothetical protein